MIEIPVSVGWHVLSVMQGQHLILNPFKKKKKKHLILKILLQIAKLSVSLVVLVIL